MLRQRTSRLDPAFNYSGVLAKYADTIFTDADFIDYKVRRDLGVYTQRNTYVRHGKLARSAPK